MKYIVTILAILMVSGYGVSRLMDTGMRQVEQVGNIKRNAEKRLEIIREATAGLVKETAAETDVIEAAEPVQASRPERQAEVFHVRMDDSVSLVILRLGHPDSQEPVGDIQIPPVSELQHHLPARPRHRMDHSLAHRRRAAWTIHIRKRRPCTRKSSSSAMRPPTIMAN